MSIDPLKPCFFIAANYILLGRLAREIDCGDHVLLPLRRLTLVFVMSDVTTFIIQVRVEFILNEKLRSFLMMWCQRQQEPQ